MLTGVETGQEISNSEPKQVLVKTANKQIRGLRKGKKDNRAGFGSG